MKLLIDAQLPRRLSYRFREAGHDCLHTLDLPAQNSTPDEAIIAIADGDDRIIVTKDADFVSAMMLFRRPRQLLLVSTGNISNNDLERHLCANLDRIADAFISSVFVEITPTALIVHF